MDVVALLGYIEPRTVNSQASAEVAGNPAISARSVTKRFGDVVALDNVDIDLHRGEVHALMGENGAGKSTLNRVLFGLHQPDAGWLELEGQRVTVPSPAEAIDYGIGMVHQHYALVAAMTVAENVALGVETTGGRGLLPKALRRPDVRGVADRLGELSERHGLELRPNARVSDLGIGERQRVEILRALYYEARILLFDEPTAVLTPEESERLIVMLPSASRRRRCRGAGDAQTARGIERSRSVHVSTRRATRWQSAPRRS